jgi:hypothetical protein
MMKRNEPNQPGNCLIYVITKSNKQQPLTGLAKGQIWQLQHMYIQIVELGSRLLHYKMMDFLDQKGVKTQMSGIDVMWGYLKSRRARLVKAGSAA